MESFKLLELDMMKKINSGSFFYRLIVLFWIGFLPVNLPAQVNEHEIKHVIMIAADAAGGKYLEKFIQETPEKFQNFKRFIEEGAYTFNARTDYFVTVTQPNFSSMITGRPSQSLEDEESGTGHFYGRKIINFPVKIRPNLCMLSILKMDIHQVFLKLHMIMG